MRINPRKGPLKKCRPKVENSTPDVANSTLDNTKAPPQLNRDQLESMNLDKLKKSLRELIDEKEGKGVSKFKTFRL